MVRTAANSSTSSPHLIKELVPDSTISTLPHDLHRTRRAAFSSFFSKASIRRLEPAITETLDNLLQRLDTAAKKGEIMPLSNAYKATTNDIITEYCFGESTGYLLRDDYNKGFFDAMTKSLHIVWWMTHIAWLGPLLDSIPSKMQAMLIPGMEPFFAMQRVSLSIFAPKNAQKPCSGGWNRSKRSALPSLWTERRIPSSMEC